MNTIYSGIENLIDKSEVKYNELMSKHTTMKVGGPCDLFISPKTIEDLKNAIDYLNKNSIPWIIFGNGSNSIVSDDGIHGAVIRLTNNFSKIEVNGEQIIATCGASMPLLSQTAKKNSLEGLEFACGIPGTIGGGVRMNAGAYGGQMSDVVESVEFIDASTMNIVTLKNDELKFGYRHSIFLENKNYIILKVIFKLKKGNIEQIDSKMKENNLARHTKQPLEYPSAGSVFKRPVGYFVGKLVQDAGLRGVSVGGAQVSEKHTGFIVNKGGATCKDILDLIKLVQNTVFEKFGVKLEVEPEIIGGKK